MTTADQTLGTHRVSGHDLITGTGPLKVGPGKVLSRFTICNNVSWSGTYLDFMAATYVGGKAADHSLFRRSRNRVSKVYSVLAAYMGECTVTCVPSTYMGGDGGGVYFSIIFSISFGYIDLCCTNDTVVRLQYWKPGHNAEVGLVQLDDARDLEALLVVINWEALDDTFAAINAELLTWLVKTGSIKA